MYTLERNRFVLVQHIAAGFCAAGGEFIYTYRLLKLEVQQLTRIRCATTGLIIAAGIIVFTALSFIGPISADAQQVIRIFINGSEINSDVQPVIINSRTMVPIRAISEGLGMNVEWDGVNRQVLISNPALDLIEDNSGEDIIPTDGDLTIMGMSTVSAEALKQIMLANNPQAPADLPELYLQIAKDYGIRGDVAFCQAAKETGWWRYGGLVQAYQNNYCGLGATGSPATGNEDLRGADSSRVWFAEGVHGAIFKTRADGVEAHIQHLYAYTSKSALPAGKTLVDPRFILVSRGIASTWSDLDGRWAVPGVGYGQSILNDYYAQAGQSSSSETETMTQAEKIEQLEKENQLLKLEVLRLQKLVQ